VHCDHEYLNFKGTKLSKSRGAFVEVPYFLSKYDPDPLRQPAPLYKKLYEGVIEEEHARLEG
jgi:cysteinyl-tRNA synthetase